MPIAFHCDKDECDSWSYSGKEFIFVDYGMGNMKYYCCKWCMVVQESKDVDYTETVIV